MSKPRCGVKDKVGSSDTARRKRYALQGERLIRKTILRPRLRWKKKKRVKRVKRPEEPSIGDGRQTWPSIGVVFVFICSFVFTFVLLALSTWKNVKIHFKKNRRKRLLTLNVPAAKVFGCWSFLLEWNFVVSVFVGDESFFYGVCALYLEWWHTGSRWRVKELTYSITKYPTGLRQQDVNREVARAFKVKQKKNFLKDHFFQVLER